MELENCDGHQDSNEESLGDDHKTTNGISISAVKSKPFPLPRKPSFTQNNGAPNRDKNRDTEMAFERINDKEVSNEINNKEDICVISNPNGDADDGQSLESLASSTPSEEKVSEDQISCSPRRKDQVGISYNKRGLPPLPKERKKTSSHGIETENYMNQELG